jgi:hypothetical protein
MIFYKKKRNFKGVLLLTEVFIGLNGEKSSLKAHQLLTKVSNGCYCKKQLQP